MLVFFLCGLSLRKSACIGGGCVIINQMFVFIGIKCYESITSITSAHLGGGSLVLVTDTADALEGPPPCIKNVCPPLCEK